MCVVNRLLHTYGNYMYNNNHFYSPKTHQKKKRKRQQTTVVRSNQTSISWLPHQPKLGGGNFPLFNGLTLRFLKQNSPSSKTHLRLLESDISFGKSVWNRRISNRHSIWSGPSYWRLHQPKPWDDVSPTRNGLTSMFLKHNFPTSPTLCSYTCSYIA